MNKYARFSGICQSTSEMKENGVKENSDIEIFDLKPQQDKDQDVPKIETDNIQIEMPPEETAPMEIPSTIKPSFIDDIMIRLENIRQTDVEMFNHIIGLNKELLAVVNDYEGKESLKIIEEIYSDVDYPGFLHWSATKALKIAITKVRDFELVHFFIVKQEMKLTEATFKNIINEFFDSLSDLDFINCEDDELILNYCNILHLLIRNGDAAIDSFDDRGIGYTPLQTAIIHKQYQFILFLLNNTNIDINYVNKEIKTALDICYENIGDPVYEELFNLMIPYGAEAVLYKRKVKNYLLNN